MIKEYIHAMVAIRAPGSDECDMGLSDRNSCGTKAIPHTQISRRFTWSDTSFLLITLKHNKNMTEIAAGLPALSETMKM